MKNSKRFFSEVIFQENFSASVKKLKKIFQREDLQENFLEPYAVNVVKNFIAGVGCFAKEVEEDPRKKFCHYPSA